MSYDVGEWVELTRSVQGASAGTRGRITSTGLGGGLDLTLDNGDQVTGVSADAVRHAPGGGSAGSDMGCAVVGLALASAAAAVGTAAGWWSA